LEAAATTMDNIDSNHHRIHLVSILQSLIKIIRYIGNERIDNSIWSLFVYLKRSIENDSFSESIPKLLHSSHLPIQLAASQLCGQLFSMINSRIQLSNDTDRHSFYKDFCWQLRNRHVTIDIAEQVENAQSYMIMTSIEILSHLSICLE
jgi:hypothetical protein